MFSCDGNTRPRGRIIAFDFESLDTLEKLLFKRIVLSEVLGVSKAPYRFLGSFKILTKRHS